MNFKRIICFTRVHCQRGFSKKSFRFFASQRQLIRPLFTANRIVRKKFAPLRRNSSHYLTTYKDFWSMYFWWVTRSLSPLFEFYEFFWLRRTLSFCGIATVHFLIHEKNHWVPIRAISSLPYKREHSSFNRQGDTLKLQRFFLKRKNWSGGRPSLF